MFHTEIYDNERFDINRAAKARLLRQGVVSVLCAAQCAERGRDG